MRQAHALGAAGGSLGGALGASQPASQAGDLAASHSAKQPPRQQSELNDVPVVFSRFGGASNHVPVHFLILPNAQARGLKHPLCSKT